MATPQSHPNYDPIIYPVYKAAIMEPLQKTWAFAQEGVTNRDFEGEIRGRGDTVLLSTIGDPTIKKYDESKDMDIEDLTFGKNELKIDQGDYFNFRVPLVSETQAAAPVKDPAVKRASEKMAQQVDTYIGNLMKDGVAKGNQLGAVTVDPEKKDAYRTLVALRAKLNAAAIPQDGRFVVVGPEFESALLFDDRLDRAVNSTNVLNGEIGRLLGFRIISSANMPTKSGAELVIAGHPMATPFGYNITGIWESTELPKRIAKVVTGLQVYGGTVVRPEGLASAEVKLPTPAAGGASQ